ncbi:thiopurine S-methyltransferase [Agarilytica rhodophyticola]|uniref:thiopurine S-methyltransferase n=1 Tax=Agarilytica rhodophyticola TaxID=1737490 RepID=UPI000B345EB7|nr:thiopurine S-methyltransferase [Agarilytica rhodophyticola]
MDADFWHTKWEKNDIAFHEGKANTMLVKHFEALDLSVGSRIFVPLCGKTVDIHWLLSQGYNVVGVEINEMAIQQLFDDLQLTPQISDVPDLKHYSAKDIDIFVGDVFKLTPQLLAKVDGIYDRASLVALPEETREQYAIHLIHITQAAPQLLISFDYDQSLLNGPPFSITETEIQSHYKKHYNIKLVDKVVTPYKLKDQFAVDECVRILTKIGTKD